MKYTNISTYILVNILKSYNKNQTKLFKQLFIFLLCLLFIRIKSLLKDYDRCKRSKSIYRILIFVIHLNALIL